jgi:RNA polymerase sigma-70 factor (ECF subfamily)
MEPAGERRTVAADQSASDEALMARYARGDAQAFQKIFDRYESRAYRYFLTRTRSEARAADLYQELFLRVHRAREAYDPTRSFAAWFFQIARRLWIDELRREKVRRLEVPLEEDVAACGSLVRTEQRLVAAEDALGALAQLSEVERYVLVSAKLEGRSYADLARELGRTVVAVKKMASRAMQRLRSGAGTAVPA